MANAVILLLNFINPEESASLGTNGETFFISDDAGNLGSFRLLLAPDPHLRLIDFFLFISCRLVRQSLNLPQRILGRERNVDQVFDLAVLYDEQVVLGAHGHKEALLIEEDCVQKVVFALVLDWN